MSEAGVYLTNETWDKVKLLLDSVVLNHTKNDAGGAATFNQLIGWIKVTDDLTTYDETTDDPVETDGYTYIYKGVMTYYDPVAQDWNDDTDVIKVVGPNDEELTVNWRYSCCCWGEDGTVSSISTPVDPGNFPKDEDGNDVATIWMPLFPTHCQAVVKCDQDGPRTVYMQLPTEYESSGCTGQTDESFVNAESGGDGDGGD